jgi:hypothetical protein
MIWLPALHIGLRTAWLWRRCIHEATDILEAHQPVRQASGHCWRHSQRLVDAHSVVEHGVERDHVDVASNFFENAFVIRVKRRLCILRVKFDHSTYDVLMCFGSGSPSMILVVMPMHSAGL